jgi:hypothetical protein
VTIISAAAVIGGPTISARDLTLDIPGRYLICGYLHDSSATAPPRAASTSPLTVGGGAPVPAPSASQCVVPAIVRNEALATARTRLLAASCAPGAARYLASSRYVRGSVFNVSPAPGTVLPAGSAIIMYVSTGRRCVVPKLPKSRSLTIVKRRLKAANCTVGKVTRLRSRTRKRGRVIGLSPGVGKRLASRAKVRIMVSSGKPR